MSRIVDTIRHGGRDGAPERRLTDRGRRGDLQLGAVAYFQIHDRAAVERVVSGLERVGIRHLRTAVSWADWHTEHGREWYAWLLPRLTSRFKVMPCVLYTPPSLGLLPKTSSPPRDPLAYAAFVEMLLAEYGDEFPHVELWNEPNNYIEWDWTIDPDWKIFGTMIAAAADRARQVGVVPVLGGMSPLDPNWLNLMFERGAMDAIGVVGIHGFPGTWEAVWEGWDATAQRVRDVLDAHRSNADIWITECGFSTWAHDEYRQLTELVDVAQAPVTRAYWYSAEDLDPTRSTLDGFHADERAYHFGLYRSDGTSKLAARVWSERGLEGLGEIARLGERRPRGVGGRKAALVTGGAGFVGTNLADRLASSGKPVVVLDSLARSGVDRNLSWLKQTHGDLVRVEVADLRDRFAIRRALDDCDQVFHLAAQVAVTTSLDDPQRDFAVNLQGTLNLLEEVRRLRDRPPLLFTSTNKVYGTLDDVDVVEADTRYEPIDEHVRRRGIGEARPLDFSSPYGCSKGGADQYVLDYAKTYGLRTAVFRMSCIYGPHQFGTEDQGWVAHFLIQALRRAGVSIYGDGKQVRDILFVDDLVDALLLGIEHDDVMCGRAFNIGGGPSQTVSLLEVLDLISNLHGSTRDVAFRDWRVADQRYYVSDTTRFTHATGWRPQVGVEEGLEKLYRWLRSGSRYGGRLLEAQPVFS